MFNTILISLLYTTFIFERFYYYICYNKNNNNDGVLNFNQGLSQPFNYKQPLSQSLNIDENIQYPITDNNTNITEYIMNQDRHSSL